MSSAPQITVLMSVYNGEDYLDQSIQSILDQTCRDFEFLIINDGSNDKTKEILERYAKADPRIKIVHQDNMGLTKALNIGLFQALGQWVARLDADDISAPDRLQKQMDVMQDANIILCGSRCVNLYPDGTERIWRHRSDNEIRNTILYFTPFAHSTVMMRKDAAINAGGYDETYKTSQDTEFWMRLSSLGQVTMIDDVLVTRHMPDNAIGQKNSSQQRRDSLRARMMHNKTLWRKIIALYYTARIFILNAMPMSLKERLKK